MGFFDKLFSGRKEYPELDAASPAGRRLRQVQAPLESLASQVRDNLEVVPADERAFVFIGKPPKQFGLAWIEGTEVRNLKSLMDDGTVPKEKMPRIVEELRKAYEESEGEPRYRATVAGRAVVVAPSSRLTRQVQGIIETAEA